MKRKSELQVHDYDNLPPLPPPQKKKNSTRLILRFWRKFSPIHKWVHKNCVLAFHPQIYYENTHPTHNFYDNAFQVDVNITF